VLIAPPDFFRPHELFLSAFAHVLVKEAGRHENKEPEQAIKRRPACPENWLAAI
jgi:hypothetical protein